MPPAPPPVSRVETVDERVAGPAAATVVFEEPQKPEEPREGSY
jgi:hypothetical protein